MLQVPLLQAQNQTTPITSVSFNRLGGFIGLGAERENDYRENLRTNMPIKELDEALFEELGLGVDGYVYHPRLLEFKADTKFIFKQESETSNMQFQQELRDKYTDYNLSMLILKSHPISMTLLANRNTQDTNSSFFESQRLTTTQKGVALHYRHKLFPTDLGYDTLSSVGEGQDKTNDKLNRAYLSIRNEGMLGTSTLRYENERRSQAVAHLDLQTDLVNASNTYHFGSKEQHALTSLFRWRDQTGTIPYRDITVGENIYIRHTKNLDSYYRYDYEDSRLVGKVTKQHRYRAGLKHQLYESLSTGVELNGENYTLNSGKKDTLSAELRFNYRKRLSFGRLTLNYRTFIENTDENFSEDKSHISREEHFFGENPEGDDVILLKRDLVDEATIKIEDKDSLEITDPVTGLPIEEGLHYRLEKSGTLTKIRLLPAYGDFLLGKTVYISYDFEPTPPIEFETRTQTYGGQLDIKRAWRVFYYAGSSDQSLKGGNDIGRLEDIRDKSFGTEIKWKNSTTRAEKTIHKSVRNPYKTTKYSEVLIFRLKNLRYFNPVLNLNASYSETSTFEYIEDSIDRTVSAKLFLFLPYRAKCDIETQYRNQELVGEKQVSFNFRTNLRWRYRTLDITLTYENLNRNQETTIGKEKRERIYLRARRLFGSRR